MSHKKNRRSIGLTSPPILNAYRDLKLFYNRLFVFVKIC